MVPDLTSGGYTRVFGGLCRDTSLLRLAYAISAEARLSPGPLASFIVAAPNFCPPILSLEIIFLPTFFPPPANGKDVEDGDVGVP